MLGASIIFALSSPASANDEFQQWLKQEKSSFKQYVEKQDREFTAFLKQRWKEVDVSAGKVRDKEPKPVKLPKSEVKPLPVIPQQPVVILKPVVPVTPPKPVIIKPTKIKGPSLNLNFFGTSLKFAYDKNITQPLRGKIDNKVIADHWHKLSASEFKPLLKQLNDYSQELELNDWSFALLVDQLSEKLIPRNANSQAITSWFLLVKSGYKARVAYNSRQLFLLMPTQQPLYGVTYFTFDQQRYYAVGLNKGPMKIGKVFTYNGNYPDANKIFDLELNRYPASKEVGDKRLKFKYKEDTFHLNIQYQPQVVKYLNTYPQMDIKYYFNAPIADTTRSSLLNQLTPLLQGKSEFEATNLLLRFVQKAFPYKTDEEQFAEENYLFPVETVFYPYSDCEDRSVLFAWLTKTLLGLDVVGLNYPGHITTAVAFKDSDVPGDSFNFKGKRYVMADPTYINANVGMTMPQFKNTKPDFIPVQ